MKKKPFFLVVLVALALTLFSCDGTVTVTSDQGIAFAVFQLIPEGDYDVHFRGKTYTCPDDCTRHFGDEVEYDDYGNHGTERFMVDCFPKDGGGWLAVLSRYGCFDYCSYGRGKAYIYKDGVLNEAPDMLPTPLYKGEELDHDFYQRYCFGQQLIVAVVGLETDKWGEPFISQETTYKWDGHQFVEIDNQEFPFGDAEEEEVAEADTCDMEALFQAMYDEDDMYREFESQMDYTTNHMHGWAFSRVDSYSSSLDVSCTPTAKGVFKVVAVLNWTENGEESSLTEIYWYKDGVLYGYDDDE